MSKTVVNYYSDRTVAIATQHSKEQAISPLLYKKLKLLSIVPYGINTDLLGTFSGEISRDGSPLNTARKKCDLAYALGFDLVISSEGSFGPHPTIPFIHCDEEIILMKDYQTDEEILASHISINTNFSAKAIQSLDELAKFSEEVFFPSHGIIMKDKDCDFNYVNKEILIESDLVNAFEYCMMQYGNCFVETDMRAHKNPTRMRAIEEVCWKLIDKVKTLCPICSKPGFSVHDQIRGLPCALCYMPTKSIHTHISVCQKCGHREDKTFPNNKEYEDPQYCDFCNP